MEEKQFKELLDVPSKSYREIAWQLKRIADALEKNKEVGQ